MKAASQKTADRINVAAIGFPFPAFLALLIVLLQPDLSLAQPGEGAISGAIADSAGAMVSGAEIEAKNQATQARYTTTSKEAGVFLIERVPTGDYDIKVLQPGFRPFVARGAKVQSGQTLHLRAVLEIDSIHQTITVNAPSPQQLMDQPLQEPEALQLAVSSVSRLQMEQQGSKNIVDGLNYIPGAWIETRGRKAKEFLSVRGQRYPYPEYSIDGALFREFHEIPYFISSEDIERVDVLRSGASLLKGISGLAGVIDVVPRSYEKRETSVRGEYGSRNSYRLHASHGQKLGKVSYGLGVDGFRVDGPGYRRGDERMLNLFANVSLKLLPSLTIRTTALYLRGRSELVQAELPAAKQYRIALESYDPVKTTVFSINAFYRPVSWASTQFTAGYRNGHNSFVTDTTPPRKVTPDYDSEWNLNLTQSLAVSSRNVVRVGANYNHWISPYGKRFFAGRRSELETHSVSLLDEHSFGKLVLDGGVRYQRTYIDEYGAFNIEGTATGFSKVAAIKDVWGHPEFSGSAGATYFATKGFSLRGSFLAGMVEPRTGAVKLAGTAYTEPATEHRIMADVGFSLARDSIGEFSLTAFDLRQQDAVVLSGASATVNGVVTELYDNRDQDTKGIEFSFRSQPVLEGHSLFLNLTGMRPQVRQQQSMTRDPQKPRVILGAGILGKRRGFDYNFFWKFVSAYQSSRFADPAELQPLGHFHTLNLTIGRSLSRGERTRVYLEMINITGNHYSTVVGYPDYGRRLMMGVRQGF
jgi:outer membrane receptor protein involved in Fe transport